jgi:hypothetical protein
MPSWLSLCSSNLLLSLQGVQQPCEDPSVDSSFNYRTQRSYLLLCLSAHCLNPLLAECLLPELLVVLSPSAHPMRLLNAHLVELSESSVVMFLLQNSQQSSSQCTVVHMLNAHLAEISESSAILVLSELIAEFFLCALLAPAQCPLGRAS